MVVKQIPKHVIEGRFNLRKSVKNLAVGKCIAVKSISYARNVQNMLHNTTNYRYKTWKEDSESFIGRIE